MTVVIKPGNTENTVVAERGGSTVNSQEPTAISQSVSRQSELGIFSELASVTMRVIILLLCLILHSVSPRGIGQFVSGQSTG